MKKDCVYDSKCYLHGAVVTISDVEVVCDDGLWEKSQSKQGITIGPGESLSDI